MTSKFWIGLVVGLVIGWLIEWVVDWMYWRKRYQRVTQQLEEKKDDLREIKGVGKMLEKRLNSAGIFTYQALSKMSQREIEKIIGDAKKPADKADLIKHAKKFASRKIKKK